MKAQLKHQLLVATAVCWAAATIVALSLTLIDGDIDENAQEFAVFLFVYLFAFPIVLGLIYLFITNDTMDDESKMHKYIEVIKCPECQCRCETIIDCSSPFNFIHDCEHCGHVITESEWEAVSPPIQRRGERLNHFKKNSSYEE